MAPLWIPAAKALEIVAGRNDPHAAKFAICSHAYVGVIRARAKRLVRNKQQDYNIELPTILWWAVGHAALTQNWDLGDFSTVKDSTDYQAFDVHFDLNGIIKLIDFERRPEIMRSLSVAGNPQWLLASAAQNFVSQNSNIDPSRSGAALIDQCRLGLVVGRAVQCQIGLGGKPENWDFEEREWNIEPWFWQNFTGSESSSQDWQRGVFAGKGSYKHKIAWITLTGVYFLKSSLSVFVSVEGSQFDDDDDGDDDSSLPPLPDTKLLQWWNKRINVRDSLGRDELLVLLRAAFPENSITRIRLRTLMGERRRGPKPIG